MGVRFRTLRRAGSARVGLLDTPHGPVETPAFMPVGTQGAVKALAPTDLKEIGAQIVLCNAYHLYLRPGHELVRRAGGLHSFMGWEGPILTDSGGYQVLSLADLRRVEDDGVLFRSHLDGSEHFLTPEGVVEIQEALGSDIAMVLDECIGYPATREEAERAAERTLLWAERSLGARRGGSALFGIVQGSTFPDLRGRCASALASMTFDGYAVGGLSVGETKEEMYEALEASLEPLPADAPRYLMGVGTPLEVLRSIEAGIDLFDCVVPTRLARHGTLVTSRGYLTVRNAAFAEDLGPPDPGCGCRTCRTHSRAYLRHLFKAGEVLALRLASHHNLHYVISLLERARRAVARGALADLIEEVEEVYGTAGERAQGDELRDERDGWNEAGATVTRERPRQRR